MSWIEGRLEGFGIWTLEGRECVLGCDEGGKFRGRFSRLVFIAEERKKKKQEKEREK